MVREARRYTIAVRGTKGTRKSSSFVDYVGVEAK